MTLRGTDVLEVVTGSIVVTVIYPGNISTAPATLSVAQGSDGQGKDF